MIIMNTNDNNPLGQVVSGLKGLASAFVNSSASAGTEKSDTPTVTLRYSTEKVTIEADDATMSKTVRTLFEENATRLSLPTGGSIGVRSDGQAVDSASKPEPGRTYTASVSRETKGN